jgi:dienelactone hydrolase
MNSMRSFLLAAVFATSAAYAQTETQSISSEQTQSSAIAQRDVQFYSEAVLCYGRIYLPKGFSASGKNAAVVLAPGAQQTSAALEQYATAIALRGIVAMTFDYRGFGKSGGYLYFGEPVRWDDRLRFSQSTTKMRIRRKRVIPQAQVIDIRNALTFLQGEPGVDRSRIGLWGIDLSGGHAVVTAGSDARVKAIVAQTPMLDGSDKPRKAFAPTAQQQATMVKLARSGAAPSTLSAATTMNSEESALAFAEYHPYWYLDQIPDSTAVRFILGEKDKGTAIDTNVTSAAKLIKGANDVVRLSGGTTGGASVAAQSAADWFATKL